ncbi:hypothetical protein ATL42_0787 [Sanguibacter antarcticus]|uniref:Prenyltransferase/squalene oxidase-like repeat protein n=2 Tax=Sanguibacter antarcticus TaxID=372484 RepID=A0A2A9E3K0_9MICO|nr:hypothetical protein ATL42_0787 [Sanguibacter antarcticus]
MVLVAITLTSCSSDSSPEPVAVTEDVPGAVAAASGWLTGQAGDDGLFATEFDGQTYPDPGLTADVVLALSASGETLGAGDIARALADPAVVASYVGDGTTSLYVGSTAKLAATLAVARLDSAEETGRDLLEELAAREAPSGRFTDLGEPDYSQTISQSWAVLALSQAGEVPSTAVDFLADQQCSGEGYPAALTDEPTGTCDADPDATGFAVSALVSAGVPADDPRVAGAVDWLTEAAQTDDDGQFWFSAEPAEASVNSTAVAAVALRDAGEDDTQALAWLEAQMVVSGDDAGSFTVADVPDARATSQALVALAGTGLAGLLG